MFKSARDILNKSREIDRGFGQHAEKLSRFIWPWQEHWLWLVVGSLAILDFTSTYILLDVSGKNNVYESGRLAIWALDRGGFLFLLLIDLMAAVILSLAALAARYIYVKHGCKGYGRAAFVVLLMPYIIITALAILNNLILLFR
jgi:hypothetical protein